LSFELAKDNSKLKTQNSKLGAAVVTIGAYGFEEEGFFRALKDAGVGTFCDIRMRRGMRGSAYAFANSARLQRRLGEMGIKYVHAKELAPGKEIRALQDQEDKRKRVAKRARTTLGQAFIEAYRSERLAGFDPARFIEPRTRPRRGVPLLRRGRPRRLPPLPGGRKAGKRPGPPGPAHTKE
jgi:uncharacterized protein DUF488